MSRVGLGVRCGVLAFAFLVLCPLLLAVRPLSRAGAGRVTVAFHRLFLRLFHIRVSIRGHAPPADLPTLIVANHVSWLDIPVLASLAPLSFVAKHEVAGWPVVGTLARLQRCIFVDRARKAATAEVNALVADRLAAGDRVVLFPEGTTGDGTRLLPFRSSLVGAARNALAISATHHIRLQPLAIAYARRLGLPLTRRTMPLVAWYGDMDLVPHAAGALRGGPLDVSAIWGEPILIGPETDRKRATGRAEAAVRAALAGEKRTGADADATRSSYSVAGA